MTPDTKSEIVIVAIAGVFLWWLWHKNRAGGAGTGLNLNLSPANPVPASSGTGFQIPSPTAGDIFQYTGNTVPNPAPLSLGVTGAAAIVLSLGGFLDAARGAAARGWALGLLALGVGALCVLGFAPFVVSPGVVESSVSPSKSTRRPVPSSRPSSRLSFVTPLPTPSTRSARP